MLREAEAVAGGDEARELLERSPFAEHVGLRIAAMEPDRAKVVLPVRPWVLGAAGVTHRGAVSALVELAATAAAWADDPEAEPTGGQAVDLFVNYLRTAPQHPLTADARVVRRDGTVCFCAVDVRDWELELVAKGSVTYWLGSAER
jgi:uncharacterized protein (TIGR00369 family)